MPFPNTSPDLMANVMGGSILSSSSTVNTPLSGAVSASLNSSSSKTKKDANSASGSGTVRIFYSLQENPNAIISYADLIRLEQKRQRAAQLQTSPLSKSGATATSSASTGVTPNVTGSSSTTASLPTSSPLKNSKVTGTGAGASIKDVSQSSTTAMDIDPPEGEEALGEGDSEAEDDDEEDEEEHDEENEDGTEAEDEDDDEDPDEDDEEEDDPESGKREPKDFLEALTEKYAGLEEGNEGEDEDEDEDDDGKGQVYKRPSRWDTEHYDIEDEFIDDSEMMLESIGMVRPKIDGFFAYRGPVEITNEDPDSSDAGPRSRKPAKRKQAAASSPLNTGKGATKSSKGSSLAVMENANDSMSEMSEMDDKPKPTKNSVISGLANSTIPSNEGSAAAAGAEGGTNSATATPKKKNAPSKSKAAGKELNKDGVEAKDSDKESKAGPSKKAKSKPSKSSATSSTPAVSTPIVRIESPQPMDDNADNSTPPPEPVRASSPSRSKSKPKASATVEQDSTATGAPSENAEALVSSSTPPSLETASAVNESAKGSAKLNTVASEAGSKSKGHRTLEPLNEEVQVAYDIVADLARKETWEVKARFPPHIKAPLFECARIALATRSSGYVLEDSFFVHLQAVLPYNKFTLKKLIYKNVLPGWIADLEAQKSRLIEQFTTRANMVWKASGLADQPEKDGDGDVNMSGEEGKPQRKFPWSQDLRLLLWETMEKFMEILAARQEFRAIDENQPAPPSDSKTRKDAYQTLLLSFPSGWMTSYEISRQYSQLKEKVQKQEKREVESNSTTVPIGKPRPVFSGNIGPKSGNVPSTVRSAGAQSSSSTSSTDKQPSSAAPVTPAPSTTSPALSAAALPPSSLLTTSQSADAPREGTQRMSPSISPSIVSRSAHLSEIVHPASQQPRTQHALYMGGPMAGSGKSAASKKRKNPEEGVIQPHASESGHDTIHITEPTYDDPANYRKNNSVPDYASNPSSNPSTNTGNPAMYSSMLSSEATKKKRATDQRLPSSMSTGPTPMGHHPGSAPSSYHQGARESMYQQRHPPSPPQTYASHPSRGYPVPPSQQPQHPSPHLHYQHHEPSSSQHHHRVGSSSGSSGGGNAYAPSVHSSPSRVLPPPSGPQTSSAPKAMSMSNLLHHPLPPQQQSHHSRQGPA